VACGEDGHERLDARARLQPRDFVEIDTLDSLRWLVQFTSERFDDGTVRTVRTSILH
jgi:hypothetical protein